MIPDYYVEVLYREETKEGSRDVLKRIYRGLCDAYIPKAGETLYLYSNPLESIDPRHYRGQYFPLNS